MVSISYQACIARASAAYYSITSCIQRSQTSLPPLRQAGRQHSQSMAPSGDDRAQTGPSPSLSWPQMSSLYGCVRSRRAENQPLINNNKWLRTLFTLTSSRGSGTIFWGNKWRPTMFLIPMRFMFFEGE